MLNYSSFFQETLEKTTLLCYNIENAFNLRGVLTLIRVENHLGSIDISNEYLTTLIGHTVTSCFGVVHMNAFGAKQGFLSLLNKGNTYDKGVIIRQNRDRIIIDLHITVSYGVNISAIVDSIINKVRYTVEEETDLTVIKVNVFIDGMKS